MGPYGTAGTGLPGLVGQFSRETRPVVAALGFSSSLGICPVIATTGALWMFRRPVGRANQHEVAAFSRSPGMAGIVRLAPLLLCSLIEFTQPLGFFGSIGSDIHILRSRLLGSLLTLPTTIMHPADGS